MKKKILSILLICLLTISLVGCCSSDNSKQDEKIENIKTFLIKINNKDFDGAVKLLDKNQINETMKIDLPSEEFIKALNRSLNDEQNEMKYDVDSIRKISKEELLNEMSKMDENELLKSRKDLIDLVDGYNLYIVEVEASFDGEKANFHDVIFANTTDSKLSGSVFLNGIISYYYNAVYNKPNS